MEARIRDNRIVLSIGTAIGFKMIAKNEQKIDLNLTESRDNSKFYVLFDENDVDFQIEINNSQCIHGIGYTLIVNNGFYDYYIGAREVWTMEALYTRGRKLHFISEKSEEGKDVIQKTAEEYDISYSESAAICSRIEFILEAEKKEQKNMESPVDTVDTQANAQPSNLLRSNPHALGFCAPMARSSGSNDLVDSCLREMSTSLADQSADQSIALDRINQKASHNVTRAFCLAQPVVKGDEKTEKRSKMQSNHGDRGVVCFGEESSQLYNPYGGFTKDNDLVIKPFVVELRLSKK